MNPDRSHGVRLRDITEEDLPIFFEQQLDPDANYMAAFTPKDPGDRQSFAARWARILADPTTSKKTILYDGQVAGSVLSYFYEGHPEVGYWLGKSFWGKGVATQALKDFLAGFTPRPVYARVVHDHAASRRVLEKCGFKRAGEAKGFAHARGQEVEEFIFELD